MRSTRFSRTPLLPLLAAFLLALIAVDTAPARAAETMPDVVGQTRRAAVRSLEARGFRVEVVTIAGHPAGVVAAQEPDAGEPVEAGDEVEIHVGVRINIDTTAPNVVGMTEQQVIDALDDTYFLQIAYVSGSDRRSGRVKAQDPAAGRSVPYRGIFRVQIVRNGTEVPTLVGRQEGEAVAMLEELGLVARITHVREGRGRPGLVLSQLPRSGAEILPGGTVELSVRGSRPAGGRRRRVRVPDVVGLSMRDAENLLFGIGLMPHDHLVGATRKPAWSVLSQEVAPGTVVREGTNIGFNVAKPATPGGRVRVPALYGSSEADARELLTHMGLRANITRVDSALPVGTVFWQSKFHGSLMRVGDVLTVRVARTPPDDWAPSSVRVPQLEGRNVGPAIVALMTSRLDWRLRRDTGPGQDLARIFRQEPGAGERVPEGTAVTFYLPLRATVPNIVGKRRIEALDMLQAAGLQGLASERGSGRRGSPTKVIHQQYTAGKVIARGSLVKFRYKRIDVPDPLVLVPSVVGMELERAQNRLRAQGFRVGLRSLHVGHGRKVVISQIPLGGSSAPRGSVVTTTYRYVGGGGGVFGAVVRVPRVIGLTKNVAADRLRAAGFSVRASRTGPSNPFFGTTVVAQSPLAGSMMVPGSRVSITYRHLGSAGGRGNVTVPNVTGVTLDRAVDRLRRAGLNVTVSGFGTRVRTQSIPAGSVVARGSNVTLRVRF